MVLDHTTALGRISVATSADIAFYSGGISARVETMRITSAGYVGIGTASPGYTLDVNGQARITTGLVISPVASTLYTGDGILSNYSTTNGVYLNGNAAGWLQLNGDGTNRAQRIQLYGGASGVVQVYTSNVERMRITSGGDVGIGTSSPAYKLDIQTAGTGVTARASAGNAYLRLEPVYGVGASYIDFSASGSSAQDARISSGNGSVSNLIFQTGGASLAERMRIDSSGNVGIGTSSPSYLLDVNGQARTNGLRLGIQTGLYNVDATLSNYQSSNGVYLNGNAAGWVNVAADGTLATQIRMYGSTNASANIMAFQTNSLERMRITAAGNVGIGTGSPSQLLEVAGTTSSVVIKTTSTTGANFNYYGSSNANFYVGLDSSTGSSFGVANAGYIWQTNSYPVIIATANAERMRIDSSGNVKLSTANTVIQNSSGNPILRQTGSVLQVVQYVNTTQYYVTGTNTVFSTTFTPTASTSKVLMFWAIAFGLSNPNGGYQILRNGTSVQNAGGTYGGGSGYYSTDDFNSPFGAYSIYPGTWVYLDSPATTSAITYAFAINGCTDVYVNRATQSTSVGYGTTTVIFMEIAG
jgi:hypothetical protein